MHAQFGTPTLVLGLGVVFTSLLIAACVSDLRTRRIPNWLVGSIAVAGLGSAIALNGLIPGGGRALLGGASGLAIWLPFWLLHMMGGGDVKLFAAGATWLGPTSALEGALFAGLCGGVLSLAYLVFQHGPRYAAVRLSHGMWQPSALREVASPAWERRLPYALAMAVGLLLAFWRPGLLLGGTP